MLNELFSRIGKSIAPSGGGVVAAVFQREIVGFPPFGTILLTGTEPLVLTWIYQGSNIEGWFQYGSFPYYVRADGNGGEFLDFESGYSSRIETAVTNQVIDDSESNSATTRIIYKGGYGAQDSRAGTWSECQRVGTTGYGTSGSLYVNINGTDYQIGSYSLTEYYDGVCGVYTDSTNSYYSYGTWITNDSMYNYYSDGMGGYYSESTGGSSYPSYGTWLDGNSSNLEVYYSSTWFNGYLVIGTSYYNLYADGMGGTYSESGSSYLSYGTQIGSFYDSESFTTYYIYSDGMGGYYTFN